MRWTALLATLALAGCTAAPRLPDTGDWPGRRAELQALEAWRMSGRVAVSVDGQGASARLDWRQAGAASDLLLSGPFNSGALRVRLGPAGLLLEDGRGGRLEDEEARRFLADRLGTDLPLGALRYWMLGTPAPGEPYSEVIGPDGRPSAFDQAGWRVEIARYAPAPAGALPASLKAERGPARVKLVVSRWEIGP